MKMITVRADREFDALLTRLTRPMKTTRSGVIRDAVSRSQQELEREALRRQLRDASLKTRAEAEQGAEPGRIRPCIVMQRDLLNGAGHPSKTALPLTKQRLNEAPPLRYRLKA